MNDHELQPGYMLEEYRIEDTLGSGGFGITYLATDANSDNKVAIKEYLPNEFAVRCDGQVVAKSRKVSSKYLWGLKRFREEAKRLGQINAFNVVRLFRFMEANGTAYIVMEYCEGGCLLELLSVQPVLPEPQVFSLISSIATGLAEIHAQNLFHRDITPANIMFRKDGTPVLVDFFSARQVIRHRTSNITVTYTPGYAPIEQYSEKSKIGPWVDIYALGGIAYQCLTGDKPEEAASRALGHDIIRLSERRNASSFLKSVDWALSLKAKERPQSIEQWQEAWGKDNLRESIKLPDIISRQRKNIAYTKSHFYRDPNISGTFQEKLFKKENTFLDNQVPFLKKLVSWFYKKDVTDTELRIQIAQKDTADCISFNKMGLRELPKEVFELTTLSVLDLANNQLAQIPRDIVKLKRLRVLNLENNKFSKLPNELNQLRELQVLKLYGNPLNIPIEILNTESARQILGFCLKTLIMPRSTPENLLIVTYLLCDKRQLHFSWFDNPNYLELEDSLKKFAEQNACAKRFGIIADKLLKEQNKVPEIWLQWQLSRDLEPIQAVIADLQDREEADVYH